MSRIGWWVRRLIQLIQVWLMRRKMEQDLSRVLRSTNGLLEARRLLRLRAEYQAQYLAAEARGDIHTARIAKGSLDAIEGLIDGQK